MKQRGLIFGLIVLLIAGAIFTVATVRSTLGLDLVGGVRGVFRATSQEPGNKLTQADMDIALSVIQRRVNKLGVSEAQVQQKGLDQFIVEIPLPPNAEALHMTADTAMQQLNAVVAPAVLEFFEFPIDPVTKQEMITVEPGKLNAKGEESYTFFGPNGQPLTEKQALAQAKVFLTGKDLLPNAAAEYAEGNEPAVSHQFDDKGTQIFAQHTTEAKQREAQTGKPSHFGVLLDGKLITYPSVRSEILNGQAQISGGFSSLEEAQRLAAQLNSGALPVNLKPLQTSLVEATLGKSAVRTSIWAGVAGLILVVLFMWGYYRLPGLLASVALLIYSLLVFAIFKLIPVTMTLPGIAGFILSVGMAVDANILIFERLKEELRDGRTLRAGIDAGFNRAFTAIFDSNACTLITCGVLGYYGTGPVKGFAVTLAVGVIVSLFTAITVTRTFLHLLDNHGALQRPEYFGINVQWMGKWAQGKDIIGKRGRYYAISLAVIVPGIIFLGMGGLHRGVDFTGGDEWIIQSSQKLTDTAVARALQDAGIQRNHYDLQIGQSLQSGDRLATIHAKPGIIKPEAETTVLNSLHTAGITDAANASNEHIDPIIGKELELNALKAIAIASLLIVLYLSFRFSQGGFKDGLKYGVCAVIAMLHDVFVVVGLFAILGYFMGVEIDTNFVTAILTIIGFSVHDTIVIFDRVRENIRRRGKGEGFEDTYNRSIVQTAARSINTSFTVLLVLLALVLFGAPVIRWFNIALLVGIISGTYSSIFNASPLVVDWENIRRRSADTSSSSATAIKRGPATSTPAKGATGFGMTPAGAPKLSGTSGGAPRERVRPNGAGVSSQKVTLSSPIINPDEETESGSPTPTDGLSETEAETLASNQRPGAARVYRAPSGKTPPKRKQRH